MPGAQGQAEGEAKAVQVNILEAKNRLSQLVKAVQAGEEVVIANRGQPVARLVRTQGHAAASGVPATPADGEGIVAWLASHPLPVYARRSPGEIEAALAEERLAWD